MKWVFFGTCTFGVSILESLQGSRHTLQAIVTKPDRPQGRSHALVAPPVKQWALVHAPSIPLLQPERASDDLFVEHMRTFTPDLFIVASYGELMKLSLLSVPRWGAVNVHASLLPRWRGAAPMRRSLMAGEKETGVTIMRMVLQLDAGDILDVAKVPIPFGTNHAQLEQLLGVAAREPLFRVLDQIETGSLHPVPQDPSLVTIAPKIVPQDLEIDWHRSALEIHHQICALAPDLGAWTWVHLRGDRKKLKIYRAVPTEGVGDWVVQCGQGHLNILEVQLEGKKRLPAGDFLRGLPAPLGNKPQDW